MQTRYTRWLAATIYLCFVLSGATGLVYEIVWMRMLNLVLGHTTYATTAVLGAFMSGLTLGSFLFGKLADRCRSPLALYGLLEAGIGASALAVPLLFGQIERLYPSLYQTLPPLALNLVQFILVTAILVVPTTLMGATLPVLSKFYVARLDTLGLKVGQLYALNTFGAVAGAVAAGFFLLPLIGMRATSLLAVSLNLGIGAFVLIADRRMGKSAFESILKNHPAVRADARQEETFPASILFFVLFGIGLSGTASMVYEIAWTRALTLVIGSSIYAFSAMLTIFLTGLGIGSLLFAWIWGRQKVGPAFFGVLELAIGFMALALVPAFQLLPDLFLGLMQQAPLSYSGALTNQFIVSFLIMILPTTLIGATFPCAAQICSASLTRLGKDVGRVYAVNTLGTIAGAFATGLFLIPWMGAQRAMVAGSALNVAIGALLVAVSDRRRTRRLGAALLVVLAFGASVYLMPGWDIRVMVSGVSIYGPLYLHGGDEVQRFKADAAAKELLFYREGINATVSVERTAQMTSLKVDGKVDASNGSDMVTQLMLGHLPLVLHPKPERVLVIGLGSGVTTGAVAQHPMVRAIDIAEIEPAIVEASRFFAAENRNVLQDPRVRVVTADARHFILAAKEHYDVISSEPSNPWMAGVANLFSREFYQLVRQRLADDGIMVQWVHSYSLFPRELKMIVNTFRQVFPHTTIWRTLEGDYLLIGTRERLTVDFAGLKARYEASPMIRNDLAVLGWRSPLAVLTLFFLDEEDTARYAEGASDNTDDRPLLEFAAPLALYARTSEENYRALKTARSQEFPPVRQLEPRLLEANRLNFARAFWARGHREEALEQLAKVPSEAPLAERIERAKLFFVLGKVAFATQEMAELAKRAPGDQMLQSYLRAGAVLNAYGFEEALREHTRTSTGKPNPTEAHNNLGLFYNAMGIRSGEKALFDLAIESFRAALGIEPEAYSIINNLGNAYFEKGMFEEASKAYQRVLEMKPDVAQTHFNLGLVYERLGDLDLAAREYRKALSLRPGWTLPLMNVRRLEATSVHGAQKK